MPSHLSPARTSSSVGRSTREGAVGDPVAKQKLSPAVRSAASLEQTYTVTFLPAHSLTLHLLSLGPLSPTPIFFNRSGHYLSPLYLLSLYNAQENLKNLSEKKLDMVMYAMHEGQESAVEIMECCAIMAHKNISSSLSTGLTTYYLYKELS